MSRGRMKLIVSAAQSVRTKNCTREKTVLTQDPFDVAAGTDAFLSLLGRAGPAAAPAAGSPDRRSACASAQMEPVEDDADSHVRRAVATRVDVWVALRRPADEHLVAPLVPDH